MKAKKKFLLITSILLLAVITCCLFAGCKSAEEKEKEYYEKVETAVKKTVGTLDSLTDVLFTKGWTASFMYAYTYYGIEEDGAIKPNTVTRGDENTKGWLKGSSEFVHFMYFEVDYTNESNYKIKTTTFKDTDRKTYYNNKDKVKNFEKKFKILDKLTYEVKDGVASGSLAEGVNPLSIIKIYTDKEIITQNGISASDNFRIYTHFMRIEFRQVYDKDGIVVTKEQNDEKKDYWSGYGEDISYNWKNVYGMTNNRLTVLYSKGKSRINQLEIYNERVLSYYTEKDKVDTSLVLKADVVAYDEMVVKFEYK
ncbi:MAG: hypothetical protein K2I46_00090 [Clostridia bacterium]|nr:hypothetical protein [Clostridia bacterium]